MDPKPWMLASQALLYLCRYNKTPERLRKPIVVASLGLAAVGTFFACKELVGAIRTHRAEKALGTTHEA